MSRRMRCIASSSRAASAVSPTPLHAAANDAFAAGALRSKEKADRKAAAVAQAAALESAGTPLDTGPDGHRTMRK